MSPFFDRPSFYLILGVAVLALVLSLRGLFRGQDFWIRVESVWGLLFGITALLAIFGPQDGLVTWELGSIACLTVVTLFGGLYALGFGIVCGLQKKRILTNRWTQTYATGIHAIQRGWALVCIGVCGIGGFFIFLWAYLTGNFHW